ncbi:MAG: TonB-dependent receptor [Pseudomonadota bacterium]
MYKHSISLLSFILASGLAAHSQDEPVIVGAVGDEESEDTRTLDQIVISGTKLGLSVQDADVSVEVFDAERIEQESLFELDDVLLRSPNVTISGTTSSITIRGINRGGVSGGGQGVTSNVYIDGAPIATTALSFGIESLWDVSQVEVLRGPQSTVQGRNALAGAIVVSTADPTYDWEFKARARYAEFNSQQYAGAISGPIIPDQLAFRVAVDYQSSDGFVDSAPLNTDFDFQDALSLRSKLLIEPQFLPDLRSELIFEFIDTDIGSTVPFVGSGVLVPDENGVLRVNPLPVTSPDFASFDFGDFQSFSDFQQNDSEILRAIVDNTYDLNENIDFKWLLTFEEVSRDRVLGDLDNLLLFVQNGTNSDFIETYTTEFTTNLKFDRFTGNIGGYYFQSSEDFFFDLQSLVQTLAPSGIQIVPADSTLSATVDTRFFTENFAFYAQGRYDLTDKITLSLGLRYDQESFTTNGGQTVAAIDNEDCAAIITETFSLPCSLFVPPPAVNIPPTETFDAILPRGSITYNFTDDISVFFSGQRGYRAGGPFVQLIPTPVTGEDQIIFGSFDPEFLTNFELGVRSQFFDRSLTLNGSVFLSLLDDQQIQLPGASGGPQDFFTENIGETTIYGLELSFDYQPTDELNFYGSLGLLDTEFTEFPFAPEDPESPFFNLNGNSGALAPNVTFTVGGSYNHNSGLFVDGSLNFTGSAETGVENLDSELLLDPNIPVINTGDFINVPTDFDRSVLAGLEERTDSRTIVNVRLGYKHENFTFSIFANNLFDDRGVIQNNFASVLPGSPPPAPGDPDFVDPADPAFDPASLPQPTGFNFFPNPTVTFQQPQTFGVSLDVRF